MKAMIAAIFFLMMVVMVHAANVQPTSDDVAARVAELIAFKNACVVAMEALTPDDLTKAIRSMQDRSINIGLSGPNGAYDKFVASLNERLSALRAVTTTTATMSTEFRDAQRASQDAIGKINIELDISMVKSGLNLGAYNELKTTLEKQRSMLNNFGTLQKTGPVNEGAVVINNRSLLYAEVLKDVETCLKAEMAKLPKTDATEIESKKAKSSPMPGPEQVLRYVMFAKEPPNSLEVDGWITRSGVNTIQKLRTSESDLLSKLKRANVVSGRTAERSKCPNRLELVLSAPELGGEVVAIFFLEGNRIKFHGIWIDGRYI